MSSDKLESFPIRFTGKNYCAWEFQFKLFIKGKELWGHIDGSNPAPRDAEALSKWKIKDARAMTWILSSVEPHLVLNQRPYKTVAVMWNYLHTVYNQDNSARRFQLECEKANFTQGTMHATSKRDQFLMKLRPDFEIARSNMMNRHHVPSLDVCLSELLREEQRIVTQATMEHRANVSAPVSVAYAAQGQNKGQDMRVVQCFSCKDFDHIARDCPKKFCNYCKKQGHIISVCPIRPERKQGTAYHASTSASSSTALSATSSVVPIPAPVALANPNTLTPEMVQQMIISAFSAFGLSGSSLPINAIGDLSSSLTDVFVSPDLSTNLLSVGQLVDNNCNINFSHSGCVAGSSVREDDCEGELKHVILLIFLSIVHHANLAKVKFYLFPIPHLVPHNVLILYIVMFGDCTYCFSCTLQTRFSASIKVLRSDSGGEYMSNEFQDFLQSKGIISQRSCPSTPQQNGVAERKNCHLLDVAMEHECWKNAMQVELQALAENHTWDIVPCPPIVKPIGSKWVFSIKLRSDGSLDRYKARLVALGNKQEYEVDYEETCAPVAKMTTIRTILAITASQSWQLHQMDVKNVFLHGDLQEEIYMKLPSGMTNSSPHDVFLPTQSQYDSSLFFHTSASSIVLLLVYVDDIIITSIDYGLITKLQQLLHTTFHMKDLGQLTYFLGLEVHHRASGISMNQHKYIQDLITLASLEDTSFVDTPMEVNVKYRKDEGDLLDDPTLYWRLVGSLIYLTTTRLDISYVVHQSCETLQKNEIEADGFSTSHHHARSLGARAKVHSLQIP
ncbi:Retrovirus-related Pol polyprotein from transposon RE1 [Vitis vinifera]|uniref:Retrovirus-related Pol polyprotein from transposon RE1 n=1 Tax=Vitis vinifera TaxID=29760 RepID=A0A438HUP0_VITVI|nr:Retrovirus-related Pol polyprotein from transposon RE1 [Vitis vinifera]